MKSLILSVAAAALIFAAPSAFAQDHKDGGHGAGHPASGAHGGGHAAPAHAATSHVVHTNSGGMNRGMHEMAAPMRSHSMMKTRASHGAVFNAQTHGNNYKRNSTRNYNDDNHNNHSYRNNSNRGSANGHANLNYNRNSARNYNNNNNHNYRNNSNRGSANGHANFNRHNVTAQHHYRYRGGTYRGPSGYTYRRWSYGEMLPSIYWARDYWIDNYSDYGLAYPPPGCVWVRYGNDAVLIDEDSGEILEVVYDQFY